MIRYKAMISNLGLCALALLLLCAAIEVTLRMMKVTTSNNTRIIPQKGVTYIPHAYYRHTKEGYSEGRFNSHGFRDYERSYDKPSNTFRILMLGDSYIEALQVQLDDSFPALLEKTLNAHASSIRFEVLALGQSGFGTAEEYVRYLNFGVAYEPDLVVLAFLTGNDFRNNSKFLNRESVGFYYVFNQEHNLVLDRSLIDAYERSITYPKRVFQALKTQSHLLSLILERAYLFNRQILETRMAEAHDNGEAVLKGDSKALPLYSDLNVYLRSPAMQWKEAIEITKALILKFKRSVEEHGSRFLLLGLSNPEQVHQEVGLELKNQYRIELDYERPDRILEDLASEHGVAFLQLMPAFREHHVKTGQYLHGFGSSHEGHWNQAGHRLAAELTFQFLKEQHLVPLKNKVL